MMSLFVAMLPAITVSAYHFDVMRGGYGNGGGYVPPTIGPQVADWGYERINAGAARAATTGTVQVAVLDTGFDTDHPDLAPVVTWCYDAINRVEGCAYVEDTDGHGTHTSSTIGAIDNDIGTVGVAAGHVELYIIKVLGTTGGDWYDLADAIRYATNGPDHVPGTADDAEVISMSLGGDLTGATDIQAYLQDAIDYARSYGVVVVAAAGNEGDGVASTIEPSWPAMSNGVIAVGATGIIDENGDWVTTWTGAETDVFPTFSNSGPYVGISAPGVYINALWNDGTTNVISGTSMATPHVAAVAALILANNPNLTPDEVYNIMAANAIDLGYDAWIQGAGLVDAYASVLAA